MTRYDMIYLLTAIWLTSSGSNTVQYTLTVKQYIEQINITEHREQNIYKKEIHKYRNKNT